MFVCKINESYILHLFNFYKIVMFTLLTMLSSAFVFLSVLIYERVQSVLPFALVIVRSKMNENRWGTF